jgi:CubicO group peptidase (beta-lactamase class C family)
MNSIDSDHAALFQPDLIRCVIILCACSLLAPKADGYSYQIPEQTGDGWATASLEKVGMDIGQMCLDGGVWKGTCVVSEAWVIQSTREAVTMDASMSPIPGLNPTYGFLWWLGTFPTGDTETYFAAGWGGQFIFVLPEPEMVVVFTAGGFEDRNYDALLQIVNRYLLPATGS